MKAKGKQVNRVEDNEPTSDEDESTSDEEYCFTVSTGKSTQHYEDNTACTIDTQRPKAKIFAKMLVEGKVVRFQVDSGATCKIIQRQDLPGKCKIETVNRQLNMYNGSSMKPLGKCQLKLLNPKNNKHYEAEFIVVKKIPLPPARLDNGTGDEFH